MNKYNQEKIKFSSEKDDWKKFVENNAINNATSDLCIVS